VEQVFGWIGQIFQTLLRLLPWLVIVPATHGGVAFVHGHRIKEWKPGLHWYWPVATAYKLIVVVRQTQMIQSKVVMTSDFKTVIVGALVTYWVNDVISAVAKIADLPSDVIERSQEAVFAEVSAHTLEDIQTDRVGFNKRLTDGVSETLNGYGVHIIACQLTEFAPCKALAIKGQAAIGHHNLWSHF
jgi:regulator of protease activity HflC (stomatin/prohibitin superfamily)